MPREVDEPAQVAGVVGQQVASLDRAGARERRGQPAVEVGLRPVADLGQPGVLADRHGAGAAHLDAVVLGRVVAGGEHRAGQVEVAGGEVEHVGGGQAGLDDVAPARSGPAAKAAARPGPLSRMSWRGHDRARRRSRRRRPRRTPGDCSSNWSGTIPRTS